MATTKPCKIRSLILTVASFAPLWGALSLSESRHFSQDFSGFNSIHKILNNPVNPVFLPSQDLPPGKLIERVVCLKDASESYALYLPPNYTPDRQWPILYAFDPGARGVRPVERFKDAAEKYGYIVVGSNNSRNGPGVPLTEIIRALFDDTQARFSIDAKRVYTTGFSGGARVAGSVAQSSEGRIAGAILCGAGFSSEKAPAKPLPFPVFSIAGSEDFNWIELRQLNRTLDSIGSANRFVTFDGDHAWPPSAVCAMAVEWMELQAMKSGGQ